MQSLHRRELRRLLKCPSLVQVRATRDASLTSAISRGIRKATGGIDRLGTYRRPRDDEDDGESSTDHYSLRRSESNRPRSDSRGRFMTGEEADHNSARSSTRRHHETRQIPGGSSTTLQDKVYSRGGRPPSPVNPGSFHERHDYREPRQNSRYASTPRSRLELERLENAGSKSGARARKILQKRPMKYEVDTEAPPGIPYTTAGSEFVYGTFAVRAALEAKRRRLYKLYKWAGEHGVEDMHDHSVAALARSQKVQVQYVAGSWDRMLMRMSGQRPHNGYVLEASPVPKLPITTLRQMKETDDDLTVEVAPQSLEDKAANQIFDSTSRLATLARTGIKSRFPLLLWLDRITDTGNIGAIIRTAYFFGVDAILIPEHGTAPFNPVTIKASAGAAEHVPVLIVKKEIEFIRASQVNGWRFFAAVAPDSASTRRKQEVRENPFIEHEALRKAPGVVMVGNEGEGLRAFLQQAADESVGVHGVRSSATGVDSLNVSVAAALLMSKFLVEPQSTPHQLGDETSQSPATVSVPTVEAETTP